MKLRIISLVLLANVYGVFLNSDDSFTIDDNQRQNENPENNYSNQNNEAAGERERPEFTELGEQIDLRYGNGAYSIVQILKSIINSGWDIVVTRRPKNSFERINKRRNPSNHLQITGSPIQVDGQLPKDETDVGPNSSNSNEAPQVIFESNKTINDTERLFDSLDLHSATQPELNSSRNVSSQIPMWVSAESMRALKVNQLSGSAQEDGGSEFGERRNVEEGSALPRFGQMAQRSARISDETSINQSSTLNNMEISGNGFEEKKGEFKNKANRRPPTDSNNKTTIDKATSFNETGSENESAQSETSKTNPECDPNVLRFATDLTIQLEQYWVKMREFTGITEEQFDVIADYVTQADKSRESRFRSTIDYVEQEIYNPFDENPPAFAKDRALLILNMANYAIGLYDATKLVFDLRRDTAPPMVLAMLYAERFYDLPRHTPDNREQMIKINCEALSKIAKDVEVTLYVVWPGAEKEEDPIEKDDGELSYKESPRSKFKSLADKDNDRLSEFSQINTGRIDLDTSDTQLLFVSTNQTELSKEENASGDKEDGKSSQEEDFDHTKINEFFSIMNNAWIASHSGVLEENRTELVAQQQNITEKDAPEKSALDKYRIMAPIDAHIELSRIKSEKSPPEQAQPEEATLGPVNIDQQTITQQSIEQQTFPTEAPPPIVFGPDLSKLPPSEQDTSKQGTPQPGAMIPNSAERFSDRITFDDNLLGF